METRKICEALRDRYQTKFGSRNTYDVDRELRGRDVAVQFHAWRELTADLPRQRRLTAH
jgi:hypothetical protein